MIKLITYGCDICEKDINIRNKWEYHYSKLQHEGESTLICKECFKKWYREHKDDDVHILEDNDRPNHKSYYHSINDANARLKLNTKYCLNGTRKVSSFLNKREFKAIGIFMLSYHPDYYESYHAIEGFCNEYV
jgi:hypothetical protein